MLKIIILLAIAAHGIGHTLFLAQLFGLADKAHPMHSWLLTGEGLAKVVGSLIWIAAAVVFCAAAYGLWTEQGWWRNAAVIAAVISIMGLVLFWTSPLTSPAMAALVFDGTVLVALLILRFPGVETVRT